MIAGIVIGSLIGAACLGYACYYCCCRSSTASTTVDTTEELGAQEQSYGHLTANKTTAQQPDPVTELRWPGQGRGAFSDGLFDCTSDLGSAFKSLWCPCLSVCHISKVAPELGNFNEWLTCCGICSALTGGFGGYLGCLIAELAFRQRARELYGIPEVPGECPDLCAVCCCQCCALSQLHRHVDRYPTQNLENSPYHTAASGEDLSYALSNDEYLSVAAGSSAGNAKESSFSGFDNGSSDDENHEI